MPAQLHLGLRGAPAYTRAAFTVSPSNAAAVAILDAWPDWRSGALVLVGPSGSGKTHLATVWARRVGAWIVTPDGPEPQGPDRPILVDDADARLQGEALFHLINLTARRGTGLLMTSRTPPGRWPAEVPDLRSRLNALPVAELREPDDALLRAMLAELFRERSIRAPQTLLDYLVTHIERSATAARQAVARLDEAGHELRRAVNRDLAVAVLGGGEPDEAA